MISISNYECLPLIKPRAGCDFWRTWLPFIYLGFDFENIPKNINEVFERVKMVTFNREPSISWEQLLEFQRRYKFKICLDIDDEIFQLPVQHSMSVIWNRSKAGERYKMMCENVDAITVTTERLAEKISKVNNNCFVIPNAVPFSDRYAEGVQFNYIERKNPETRFGWGGGISHYRDIKSIQGMFNKFPTLSFTLAGYDTTNPTTEQIWKRIERVCSFNGHNPNYRRVETKPLAEYAKFYDGIDVAVAPLEKEQVWNYFKSSLKLYEAGRKKIPVIASNIPPYADDQAQGVRLCSSNRDWIQAVKDFKDLDYAKQEGEKLFEWTKMNRNLDTVNEYRLQVYDKIVNGKNPEAKVIEMPLPEIKMTA